MKSNFLIILLLWVFTLTIAPFTQAATLSIEREISRLPLSNYLLELSEDRGPMDLEQVKSKLAAGEFAPTSRNIVNHGYTGTAYWYAFHLHNSQAESVSGVIEISFPLLDRLDVYVLDGDRMVANWQTGDTFFYEQRPIDHPDFLIPAQLEPQQKLTVFIRVDTSSTFSLPIFFSTDQGYIIAQQRSLMINGAFYGICMGLLIYNLFVFVFVRDRSFIYYVLHALFCVAYYLAVDGVFYQYFPKLIWWQQVGLYFYVLLALVFGVQFSRHFLRTQQFNIGYDRICAWVNYFLLASIIALPWVSVPTAGSLTRLAGMFVVPWLFFIGVRRLLEGYEPARYYVVAWGTLLVSTLLVILASVGFFTSFNFAIYGMKFGLIAELVLLSVAVARRINELQEEKVEFRKQTIAALAESRSKSELVAKISHELRMPLTGVLGMARLLSGEDLPEKQRRHVEAIKNAGDAMLGVIDDVLDYSRAEVGKLSLQRTDYNLEKLLNECCSMFALKAKEKRLEFFCSLSPDVPRTLQGDPIRLRQVLINLITNAFKFTQYGHIYVTVKTVFYQEKGRRLRIEVEDSGIGIARLDQMKLFNTYTQVTPSVPETESGSGLGLAISKELIELMQGEIGVDSQLGEGSCFWLEMPFHVDDEGFVYPYVPNAGKLLVVGFSKQFRQSVRSELNMRGIDVLCFRDRNHFEVEQDQWQTEQVGYVLFPQYSKEMNGFEFATMLTREHQFDAAQLVMVMSHRVAEDQIVEDVEIQKIIEMPFTVLDLVMELYSPDEVDNQLEFSSDGSSQLVEMSSNEEPNPGDLNVDVLVVEDNEINLQVIKGFLLRMGVEPRVAHNGQEGFAAFRLHAEQLDLILMDCEMPILDGYEATRKIRNYEQNEGLPGVKIVGLSAHAVLGSQERGLHAGMDDYLVKPLEFEQLSQLVESCLSAKQPKQQST